MCRSVKSHLHACLRVLRFFTLRNNFSLLLKNHKENKKLLRFYIIKKWEKKLSWNCTRSYCSCSNKKKTFHPLTIKLNFLFDLKNERKYWKVFNKQIHIMHIVCMLKVFNFHRREWEGEFIRIWEFTQRNVTGDEIKQIEYETNLSSTCWLLVYRWYERDLFLQFSAFTENFHFYFFFVGVVLLCDDNVGG